MARRSSEEMNINMIEENIPDEPKETNVVGNVEEEESTPLNPHEALKEIQEKMNKLQNLFIETQSRMRGDNTKFDTVPEKTTEMPDGSTIHVYKNGTTRRDAPIGTGSKSLGNRKTGGA